MRPGRQQQYPGADLDQSDQVRRCPLQTLDDQRRDGIQQRRRQCQADPQQILATALSRLPMGTDNRQHPEKRHAQPEQLLRGDLLTEKQRRQAHQHERLDVVDRRADGNRGTGIGGEQQHPVTDDRHAAEHRQQEGGAGQDARAQKAHDGADHQQGQRTEQAAPEHHVQHRLAGHQHEPANGPRDQHGRDHFQRAAMQ